MSFFSRASTFSALLLLCSLVNGRVIPRAETEELVARQQDPQRSLQVDPRVLQTGLTQDGTKQPNAAANQTPALTSFNNFINFCLTQNVELTNGGQKKGGSCNPTPIGTIPNENLMPASKFEFPKNLDNITPNQSFEIRMKIQNLETGSFTNPQTNYFAAPQTLNNQGVIIGHSHVVVQEIASIVDTSIADPKKFAFFLGLNAPAQNGILTASVSNGLPEGSYRVCSINSAATHQPVIVPVAQHGSLDDCVYFTVGETARQAVVQAVGAGTGNNNNNGGNNNNNNSNNSNNGGNNNNNNGGNNNGGNNNGSNNTQCTVTAANTKRNNPGGESFLTRGARFKRELLERSVAQ